MPFYVARPHVLADEFVPGYLGDSFGLFPFVHGDPLANQFDGPFLVRLIRKEVTHISGFPFGIESRHPRKQRRQDWYEPLLVAFLVGPTIATCRRITARRSVAQEV